MLLSNEERLKFAAYLRQNIASSKSIVEQMNKLPMAKQLVPMELAKMQAMEIVARMLENTSMETL